MDEATMPGLNCTFFLHTLVQISVCPDYSLTLSEKHNQKYVAILSNTYVLHKS